MDFDQGHTSRGFAVMGFTDFYGHRCSVQKSSLATKDAIWLGVNDADPQIMASDAKEHGVKTNLITGWIPYPIPDAVQLTTRMHLTQEQVQELLPILMYFANTGELPV